MFVRLSLSVAAVLALSAGAAGACPHHAPVRRVVSHVIRRPAHVACGCHRLRHVRFIHRSSNEGVGYTGPEPAFEASAYRIQESESEHWSSRHSEQDEAYGWSRDAHLSATDQDGYLTWPGKHRYDGDGDQGPACPSSCAPPPAAYAQDAYPEGPRGVYGRPAYRAAPASSERGHLDFEGGTVVHGYDEQAMDSGQTGAAPQDPHPYDDEAQPDQPPRQDRGLSQQGADRYSGHDDQP